MVNKRITVLSWAMYDLANTIFAVCIISLYFPLWITIDMGGKDIYYSIAMAVSMLLVAVAQPILGAISDRYGKRMPFLIWFTVLSVVFTAMLRLAPGLWSGLVFFAIANVGYQMCIVFYNALMVEISHEKKFGRISGMGIAFGYIGTFIALILVRPFVISGGRQAAFIPTAFFFLIFSLPCFFFVKDTVRPRQGEGKTYFEDAFISIKKTISGWRENPGLFRFLIANFICLNAINTTMMFVSIYGNKVMHFSDAQLHSFFLFSAGFAILGSVLSGFMADRIGAKKTLSAAILLWCITFFLAAIAFHKWIFWFIGPLSGLSLGATWVSGRVLVAQLAPVQKRAEIFGFFGLAGRMSAVVGPVVWGAIIFLLEPLGVVRYRIAVLSLLIFSITGLLILRKVPEN